MSAIKRRVSTLEKDANPERKLQGMELLASLYQSLYDRDPDFRQTINKDRPDLQNEPSHE